MGWGHFIVEVSHMTYAEWFDQYLALYKRKLKPKTRESYARLQGLLAPILGALDLAAITPDHIQAALNQIEDQAGSRQAQLAFALLHAALRRAVRSRHLPANPVEAVDKPDHEATPGRAITGEDWATLRPVIASDLAIALMCHAGLRRGECLGLQWGDVDLGAGLLRIRRQRLRVGGQLITQPCKSRSGARDVPIAAELAPLLRSAFRLDRARHVVGCAPETLARRWRRLQIDAGIKQPYRLHDLRHTYATRLALSGCQIKALQYLVGHASVELTLSTYTHVGPLEAAQEYKRVAGSLH